MSGAVEQISVVGIPTCNRPGLLDRCIRNVVESCLEQDRKPSVFVMDDSQSAAARQANRTVLARLRDRYGGQYFYAGHEEKLAFAERLAALGFQKDVVTFGFVDKAVSGFRGFSGYMGGGNKNALLLSTSGAMVLALDDDIVSRVGRLGSVMGGYTLAYERDPSNVWFHANRESALNFVDPVDEDILTAHEELLGRSLGELGVDTPSLIKSSGPEPLMLSRLRRSLGRIAVTISGIAGDCAWNNANYLFALNGDSLDRLVASEASYRNACTSREVVRVVDRPTVSDDHYFVGFALGLDNRQLLPPFLPHKSGDDLTFASVLWRCLPESRFGHIPRTVQHSPPNSRSFRRGAVFSSASGVGVFRIVIDLLSRCPELEARAPKDAFTVAGKQLVDLASKPTREFQALAFESVSAANRRHLNRVEEMLQARGGKPDFWAKDVCRYLEIGQQMLQRSSSVVPLDLIYEDRTPDEAMALAQAIVKLYGNLLCLWPDLLLEAQALRMNGHGLAIEVQ